MYGYQAIRAYNFIRERLATQDIAFDEYVKKDMIERDICSDYGAVERKQQELDDSDDRSKDLEEQRDKLEDKVEDLNLDIHELKIEIEELRNKEDKND